MRAAHGQTPQHVHKMQWRHYNVQVLPLLNFGSTSEEQHLEG